MSQRKKSSAELERDLDQLFQESLYVSRNFVSKKLYGLKNLGSKIRQPPSFFGHSRILQKFHFYLKYSPNLQIIVCNHLYPTRVNICLRHSYLILIETILKMAGNI